MTATIDTRADRAPVHNHTAEQFIIGALLTPGVDITPARDLTAEDFYKPRHGDLFKALIKAHDDPNVPIDPENIGEWLAAQGVNEFARLGGASYLLECWKTAQGAGTLDYHIKQVLNHSSQRQIEAGSIRLTHAATTPGVSIDDLANLARDLVELAKPRRADLDMTQLGSLINPCLNDIETRPDRPAGIPTGFTDLDRLLGGIRRKQLITIAGATSMGKSILLVDIARHVAIRQGLTVAFFSLEMDKEEIFERVLAAESAVNHHHIRDGNLDEPDWKKISNRLGPMSNAPLFLADDAPMTVQQMRTRAQRLERQHGLDLIIVDHMHLVDPSRRVNNDRERLSNISRDLKTMGMDLNVPVIAAAQLNRNPNARTDKRPQLSDLKDSSAIEQDSNVVVLIHREDYYDSQSPRAGEADLIVAKNRGGPKDIVTVAAQLHLSRFFDMAID